MEAKLPTVKEGRGRLSPMFATLVSRTGRVADCSGGGIAGFRDSWTQGLLRNVNQRMLSAWRSYVCEAGAEAV